MAQHGKRYQDAAKLVEHGRVYEPDEAMGLLKQTSTTKFDGSVEAHLRLGVDPRHADQMVRGTVSLPHGSGKVVRVAVFAQGDKAAEATAAGADMVGADDLAEKIEAGWLEFDIAVATPDMMGRVGKLGRILGRRGLMPNPKAGTVSFDLERVIGELKGGRIEFKVDKGGIIHVPFGKSSFEQDQLVDNLAALTDAVNRARPKEIKGQFFKSVTVAATMGPGIRVDVPGLLARAAA
jgi:large subunit ribosomal protein L1